jgi:hypothetical protein
MHPQLRSVIIAFVIRKKLNATMSGAPRRGRIFLLSQPVIIDQGAVILARPTFSKALRRERTAPVLAVRSCKFMKFVSPCRVPNE